MATVTTRQGDTWDILSKRLYGDEHDMHVLVSANLPYRKTVIFADGVVLTVPETDTAPNNLKTNLPPWKQR